MNSTGQKKDVELETLRSFEQAEVFNKWLFENTALTCTGQILEIGSGIGNISKYLLEQNDSVSLSDLNAGYCSILKRKYGNHPALVDIFQLDLATPHFDASYAHLYNRFDTVIALNVVEHIRDDRQAIANCKKLLNNNGMLILLVPAYQFLFNDLDRELGHQRRYTKKSLKELLQKNRLTVVNMRHFNFAGLAGWFFTGSVLKKKVIPFWQLRVFNRLVPVFKIIDKLVAKQIGLSVIAIAKNVQ